MDDGAHPSAIPPPHEPAPRDAPAATPGTPAAALVAVDGVSKSFGAVRALHQVSFELLAGEAHGLVGENGAGKSTLVKLIGGVHQPDQGAVLVEGAAVRLAGPAGAREAGVAVIHQEPAMFPDLSVAENIFMGRMPAGRFRRVDTRAMRAEVGRLMGALGVRLDPDQPARGLSIADQQLIEIAKALSFRARVLVMDEPTAALTGAEVERLFAVVRSLQAGGAAVLFISHRLDEVFALCQRVTVLRDGRHVVTRDLDGLTPEDLVRQMVGRTLDTLYPAVDHHPGEPALQVRRLTREGIFTDVSLQVRRGEIVALAGLVGAGRTEVARAIFGIDRPDAGEVTVGGRPLRRGSPTDAMAAGVGFVPEDRREQGLIMDLSIERNATLASLARLGRLGLVRATRERGQAADWAARLRLRFARLTDPVSLLSGGNQQKVVLAKWLARRPAVLLVDEPTRGVDVAAKAEVHKLLAELAAGGVAILMISSELPEVLGMADRVLVMHEGRLVAELPREAATEEAVAMAATGRSLEAAS